MITCSCGAMLKSYRLLDRGQDACQDEDGNYYAVMKSDLLAFTACGGRRPYHEVYVRIGEKGRKLNRMTGLARPLCEEGDPLVKLIVGQ